MAGSKALKHKKAAILTSEGIRVALTTKQNKKYKSVLTGIGEKMEYQEFKVMIQKRMQTMMEDSIEVLFEK